MINREQIAAQIGKSLDLPKSKVRKIILALEDQIAKDLKKKSKVKLSNFGTLYLLERKSRTIKQVKTGSKRLLLERTVIKFKSSLQLKARLVGKTFVPKKVKKASSIPRVPEKVETPQAAKTEAAPKILQKSKLVSRIKLPPLRMMPAVDREKIREKLKERLARLSLREKPKPSNISLPTSMDLHDSRCGRAFANLFREILAQGVKQLDFSITGGQSVTILIGRPRRQIASLPREVAEEFLDKYCEINDLRYPQQRFVKIKQSSKIDSKGMLDLHLFPTHSGASIHIKIQ